MEVKTVSSNDTQYRAYTREINVLFTSKDKVAVSGGIEDGEEVVMFGREFLRNGSLVNRIENDPTILEYIAPPAASASSETNIINTNAKPDAALKPNTSAAKNNSAASDQKKTSENSKTENNSNSSDTIYSVGG